MSVLCMFVCVSGLYMCCVCLRMYVCMYVCVAVLCFAHQKDADNVTGAVRLAVRVCVYLLTN